jgi:hypothetical protein
MRTTDAAQNQFVCRTDIQLFGVKNAIAGFFCVKNK